MVLLSKSEEKQGLQEQSEEKQEEGEEGRHRHRREHGRLAAHGNDSAAQTRGTEQPGGHDRRR